MYTGWEKQRELKNCELMNSLSKIERKSWDNIKVHFRHAGNTRTDKFYECFGRISRSGIESQWKIVVLFQWTSSDSKISFHAGSRQTFDTWHMKYVWFIGNCFWWSIFCSWFVSKSSSRNSSFYFIRYCRTGFTSDWNRSSCCKRWRSK